MEMRIDFYPNNNVAVQLGLNNPYPFPDSKTNELLIFACLALRQLYNLEEHIVAKALAGILVSENVFSSIYEDTIDLQTGSYLFTGLRLHTIGIVSKEKGAKASMHAQLALDSRLNFNSYMMDSLNKDFLGKVPELIEPKGIGTKSFIVSFPPLKLKPKGFGMLGRGVPYYALHSVVALARKLGRKNKADEIYLKHLSLVAQYCGTAYIFNQIPLDQTTLAFDILEKIGVS